jgi:N6-L-threonylcarbamoyladenine synthase
MLILGIESSCDETAAAVVEDGRRILSSVVASQVEIHHRYGGVVPELASRRHIEKIAAVVEEAIEQAGVDRQGLDGIAATRGPGLVGSLLVGFSFAKAFAYGLALPMLGVDHLEGHVNSVFLTDDPPPFPFVALLASGGHTSIYKVSDHCRMRLLGQTLDDAAGEAYDKVSKMLGLGYPGGEVIDRMAGRGDPEKIRFPRPYLDRERFDFSFSGIKTAVKRYIETHPEAAADEIPDIAAGFQAAVIDVLVEKLLNAAEAERCGHAALVGGVAANRGLRSRLESEGKKRAVRLHLPPVSLCGDNAAMIAAAGFHRRQAGKRTGLDADVYSRVKPVTAQ